MNITEAQYINLLDPKTTDIVVDKITQDEFQNNPNIDVVLLGYDTFGNFLFKRKFEGNTFPFFFDSPSQLVRQIQEIVKEEELNNEGLYRVEYYFVNDDLQMISKPNNRFIITEVSADRTEVRLNPLNNDEEFINLFNEFKRYRKVVEEEEQDYNIPVSEIVDNYIKKLLDKFYTEQQINTIVDNLQIILPSGLQKPSFRAYLSNYYPNNVENIVEHIKLRISATKPRVETVFKQFLGNGQTAAVETYRILLDNFFSNSNQENAEKIKRQLFNIFKTNFSKWVIAELDLKIDDGQFGEGTQPQEVTEIDITTPGFTDEPRTGGGTPISNGTGSPPGFNGSNNNDDDTTDDLTGCDKVEYNQNPGGQTGDEVECDGELYFWNGNSWELDRSDIDFI
jgi:hypothetical protein